MLKTLRGLFRFTAVDAIIEKNGKVLLVKRNFPPFRGKYAIPGGIVEYGETVEAAVVREVREETGLEVEVQEILGVYSDPKRDPTRRLIAVAFIVKIIGGRLKQKSLEIQDVRWFNLKEISRKKLAFDHAKILRDYMKWKKAGGTYWSSK
jgi:8-oxo-dGTP diphosphatase